MNNAKITMDDVLALNPCKEYTRERVAELFAGRETIDVLDVLEMEIDVADKRRFVARALAPRMRALWAVACAESVLPILEEKFPYDKCSREALEAARRWVNNPAATAWATAAWVTAAGERAAAAGERAATWVATAAAAGERAAAAEIEKQWGFLREIVLASREVKK